MDVEVPPSYEVPLIGYNEVNVCTKKFKAMKKFEYSNILKCVDSLWLVKNTRGSANEVEYRKVVSSSMSRLVAHFQIFRRLMKGKFDSYVMWPLTKIASKLNRKPVYCWQHKKERFREVYLDPIQTTCKGILTGLQS